MTDKKFILKSKTFWFNLLMGAGAAINVLPINKYTVIAGALINIVLRTITNTGVTLDSSASDTKLIN